MPFTRGVHWKCAGEVGPSTPMKFTVALLCRPRLKAGEVVTESDPLTAIEMSRHWSNRGYCQHLTIRSQRVTGSSYGMANKTKHPKCQNSWAANWLTESHSVVSDSLWPHELYSSWNSPGQNTGVGSLSLLQGIFSPQELNPGLPHCRQILHQLSQNSWADNRHCLIYSIHCQNRARMDKREVEGSTESLTKFSRTLEGRVQADADTQQPETSSWALGQSEGLQGSGNKRSLDQSLGPQGLWTHLVLISLVPKYILGLRYVSVGITNTLSLLMRAIIVGKVKWNLLKWLIPHQDSEAKAV